MIAQYLQTQGSVKSLILAHRRFYNLLPVHECLYSLTPLHRADETLLWASKHGNADLTCAMLRLLQGNKWRRRIGGNDPLIHATEGGHAAVVKLLMDYDPGVIHTQYLFDAALGTAIKRGHMDILHFLLSVTAPPPDLSEIQDDPGFGRLRRHRTALDFALSLGKEDIVHLLLADDRFALEYCSLGAAVCGGNETLVRLCLQKRPEKTPSGGSAGLCAAAGNGHVAILKILIDEAKEDPTHRLVLGQTPLHHAAMTGSAEVVKALLEIPIVDPDARDDCDATPLNLAAEFGNVDAMRVLINSMLVTVDAVDSDRMTPLCIAAKYGKTEAVRLLLFSGGANPNRHDWGGRTALSYAAERGHSDVVKVLLTSDRLKPDLPDNDERTPLSYAAEAPYKMSKTNGGDMSEAEKDLAMQEIRTIMKEQPLLVPSIKASMEKEAPPGLPKCGSLGVMEQLLQRDDVNPNSKTRAGKTPLMYAVESRQVDAVRMLMETGKMDLELQDEDGRTALKYAEGAPKPRMQPQAVYDEAGL